MARSWHFRERLEKCLLHPIVGFPRRPGSARVSGNTSHNAATEPANHGTKARFSHRAAFSAASSQEFATRPGSGPSGRHAGHLPPALLGNHNRVHIDRQTHHEQGAARVFEVSRG